LRKKVESKSREAVANLLNLFFTQTDKIELWKTALRIERCGDRGVVRRLIAALDDENPYRRHAAARALGWIDNAGPSAAKALIAALLDPSQPQPVREEAAESLAYSRYKEAIPPLISVLAEPDVRMRFWAVFAIGSIAYSRAKRGGDRRVVVEALELMLSDEEMPPGNWWPVGREALAMLGKLDPRYKEMLAVEIARVRSNPDSPPHDLRWANFYGR
jgi:HEAT repeat protein